ncbi:hypothetical protein O3M35_000080 [Rhynocoris fuscipes]|uniref:Carboxylic ester hydrolase n=1 Tax=Rhynocoris fuscipes TaxID=488301 RepID=A0AAW1DRW6_9HEMI
MSKLIQQSVAIFLGIVLTIVVVYAQQPTAQIGQGTLTGLYMKTVNGRLISAFLGIPYAKPPIGRHRFKQSIAPEPWVGVYNATVAPDMCLQYSQMSYLTETPVIGSEDCLYLNVFTPKVSPSTGPTGLLDVVVYIHGGAFMFFGSQPYGPEYLLDRDVILVTFNYRLGVLGFLSTEDNHIPGNNGLKDQNLALKWIKKNIAAFGGNPNSITLTGLSAGGASVHYHMLSPLSQGLFHRAVSMGGSSFCPWAQVESVKEKSLKIAHHLGCPTNDSLLILKCLRDRPASSIVAATSLLQPWMYFPFSPFAPSIEPAGPNAFLSEKPIDIITKGTAADVPYLVTINSDEGLYPGADILNDPKVMDEVDTNWNQHMPFILDYNYTAPAAQLDAISGKIREFYMGNSKIIDAKRPFIKMLGDRLFYDPILKSTKLHAQHYTSPVYALLFSHRGSRSTAELFGLTRETYDGTMHGTDSCYIFRATYSPIEGDPNDLLLSKRLIDYLITFIKGAPMPKGWPNVKLNLPNFGFLEIQSANEQTDTVKIEADYGNEKFWDSLNLKENIAVSTTTRDEL